jgi:hypothetical protein
MSKKKTEKVSVVNKIKKQMMLNVGAGQYRLVTVYEDYSISVGVTQHFSNLSVVSLEVK